MTWGGSGLWRGQVGHLVTGTQVGSGQIDQQLGKYILTRHASANKQIVNEYMYAECTLHGSGPWNLTV